ncbi:MAG TPA: peptide-methionine (S)-S-oxide reductase MsrA [Gemmatimonadaceae bacterium]
MRPAPVLSGMLLALVVATTPAGREHNEETAAFAGGCFWGVQWVFEHVKGVTSVVSGYSGGPLRNPTYEQVGTGTTGHAESVRIVFDPAIVSYRQLLEIFFLVAHDPTTLDRQGPDVGSDYRAIVFAQDTGQRRTVTEYIAELTARRAFSQPIVTEVRDAQPFYRAEEYHQRYAARHPDEPYIVINDAPKVMRLQQLYPALYRR